MVRIEIVQGDIMRMLKITELTCHQVGIHDIDDRPGPYCMSFGFDLEPLTRSIRRAGLINSPLLIKNSEEKLDIIIGYRRIHALKSLKWEEIPCRIVSKSELSSVECLLLNLHDNLATRRFNEVEKGMALGRLSSWFQKDEIMKHYMPVLNLPSHEPTLDFYLGLEKELGEEIKESIAKGQLSLHAAKQLLEMDDDAKTCVFQLILDLKFNVNQQKQLIEYVSDILRRDDVLIPDILEEKSLKNICCDTRMNNPQKAHAILRMLRSRIFPLLTEAEESFKKITSGLDLPKGVRISHPPFFEAPDYRMEVLFKNGGELKDKIARLSRTKGISRLHDPWEKDS